MTRIGIKGLLAGMALCAGISAAQAAVVFYDSATNFNGQFRGAGTLAVTFNAAAGSSAISFELFGANSVDGNNIYQDVFTVSLNGTDVFTGSFDMSGGGGSSTTLNALGWIWTTTTNPGGYFQGGRTLVSGFANLLGGLNTFSVTFTQPGPGNGSGQGTGDESWALNDLGVAAVPLPAALPLLGFAMAALGAMGLRRRTARQV